MKKYLSVLHDYEDGSFIEPGVSKMPSLDLQRKAINVLLQKEVPNKLKNLEPAQARSFQLQTLTLKQIKFLALYF